MNVLDYIKKRGAGFIINAAVVLIAIVALILYCVSANDQSGMTETSISAFVIVLFVIGIGMSVSTLFLNIDLVKVLTGVAFIAVFGFWAFSQADYIVNVMIGTDGNVFGAAYILCMVFTLLAAVLSFLTVIKPKKKAA